MNQIENKNLSNIFLEKLNIYKKSAIKYLITYSILFTVFIAGLIVFLYFKYADNNWASSFYLNAVKIASAVLNAIGSIFAFVYLMIWLFLILKFKKMELYVSYHKCAKEIDLIKNNTYVSFIFPIIFVPIILINIKKINDKLK